MKNKNIKHAPQKNKLFFLIFGISVLLVTAMSCRSNETSPLPFSLGLQASAINTSTASEAFSFVVMGDFNGGGCDRNDRLNRLVQRINVNEPNVDFFLSTGDIVDGYWLGGDYADQAVCFATDPGTIRPGALCGQNSAGETIPNGNMNAILSPLKDRTPPTGLVSSFYPALGNHDSNNEWSPDPCGDGICDFLNVQPSEFINNPRFAAAGGDATMCSKSDRANFPRNFYYSFAYKNSYFIFLNQNQDYYGMLNCNGLPDSECPAFCAQEPEVRKQTNPRVECYAVHQFDWLRDELKRITQAKYTHIFALAHAPLITSGYKHSATYGHTQIRALLETYNVDIFFQGHTHFYDRTHPIRGETIDNTGTVYLNVGTAGGRPSGSNVVLPHPFARQMDSGFLYDTQGNALPRDDARTTYTRIEVLDGKISGKTFSLAHNADDVKDQFEITRSVGEPPTTPTPIPELAGCQLFPADNMWNTPIDALDVHPQNTDYINSIGLNTSLHPDFGTVWNGMKIGISYDIITKDQCPADVLFTWADETDPLDLPGSVKQYPMPPNPSIEGGDDNHVILLEKDTCTLYELYNVAKTSGTTPWKADSGAIWRLDQNEVRPLGVTSADAAGLPILPGLIRYDEVYGNPALGIEPGINHAIRFTLNSIQSAYIRPASHSDGRAGFNRSLPPMGLRLRLKAGTDISTYPEPLKVILRAMKTYGIVLADTGGDMFISGEHNPNWDDDLLHDLSKIKASDFEAVYTGEIIDYGR